MRYQRGGGEERTTGQQRGNENDMCGIRIAHQPIPDHSLVKLAKFCRNNQTQVDLIGKDMKEKRCRYIPNTSSKFLRATHYVWLNVTKLLIKELFCGIMLRGN
jgi:hypothetical protein